MSISSGQVAFQLAYQISPIILTGGIAQNFGGILPLAAITDIASFAFGVVSGNATTAFANFIPVPGATLINQRLGTYPFANQYVAANAIIVDPLNVSVIMQVPAQGEGGYALKLATITAMQALLSLHNTSGGTYTVLTPSYYWFNCVMRQMRDVSPQNTHQVQTAWQIDFEQPLLTLNSALQAQNSLMGALTNGTQVTAPTSPSQSFWTQPTNNSQAASIAQGGYP